MNEAQTPQAATYNEDIVFDGLLYQIVGASGPVDKDTRLTLQEYAPIIYGQIERLEAMGEAIGQNIRVAGLFGYDEGMGRMVDRLNGLFEKCYDVEFAQYDRNMQRINKYVGGTVSAKRI